MGHRGAGGHAPENTLASIRAAARAGASWVEFDVMLSGDHVPLLFHDDKFDRLAGIDGLMAETPLADAMTLDVGSSFAPAFAGETVPALAAAIDLVLQLGLHPNLEIKPTPGRDVETALRAIDVAADRWPAARPRPFISSFSRMSLAAAMARQPDWPRGLIAFKLPEDWQTALQALDCVSIHLSETHLTRDQAAAVKAAGYQVAAFTVNDPNRARTLMTWPVDCLISDVPDAIRSALGQ